MREGLVHHTIILPTALSLPNIGSRSCTDKNFKITGFVPESPIFSNLQICRLLESFMGCPPLSLTLTKPRDRTLIPKYRFNKTKQQTHSSLGTGGTKVPSVLTFRGIRHGDSRDAIQWLRMRLVWGLRKSRDASQPINLSSVNLRWSVEWFCAVMYLK